MNISKIDKNFSLDTKIEREGLTFLDARELWLSGVFYESGKYRRMPECVAERVSEGVRVLHSNTAGGRVRFVTDSPYIAVSVKTDCIARMSHFSLTGTTALDLYSGERHLGTFIPPYDAKEGFEGVCNVGQGGMREYTLNLPLYSNLTELYIGVKEGSRIEAPGEFSLPHPVVFYGSSITQGGCASRPGCTYESILSRRLGFDHINLGFSGSARGEDEMAKYIASLDMSAFVLDYDHNAPSEEHLEMTHKSFFDTVRKAHPDLPILIVTRPKFNLSESELCRLDIIKRTYLYALSGGDRHVYFIDGRVLLAGVWDIATVDGTHPNDAGFMSMANEMEPVLKLALFGKEKRK